MPADVSMVKCACSDCVCIVQIREAVMRESRLYCSDACADHHKDVAGCHHAGCACHG